MLIDQSIGLQVSSSVARATSRSVRHQIDEPRFRGVM